MLPYSFLPNMAAAKLRNAAEKVSWKMLPSTNIHILQDIDIDVFL